MQSNPFARRVLWHIVVLSVLLTCAIGGSGGADESLTLFNNLEDQISRIAAFNTDLNIS